MYNIICIKCGELDYYTIQYMSGKGGAPAKLEPIEARSNIDSLRPQG